MKARLLVISGTLTAFCLTSVVSKAVADDKKKKADSSSEQRETVAKPMTEKERKRKEKQLQKELETHYKKWLNEDVNYIISDEEKRAFRQLNTVEERQIFSEQFWQRSDPTSDTEAN